MRGEWIIPRDPQENTVILCIHGGGFVSCSARTHRPITAALARKTGIKVFAVDYRLAPENCFPAALDDVFECYKRLKEMGVREIVLAGDSAGGGLVMSLLIRIREAGLDQPDCAVCFSPWTDLTGNSETILSNNGADAMFYPENVIDFGRAYLGEASPRNSAASPVLADHKGLCPILFQVGSTEMLLDDSRTIHANILTAGGTSELKIFDGLPHCWQMLNWFVPEAGQALRQASDFIVRMINRRDAETQSPK